MSLYWGIIGVCWGRVVYSCCAVYLNSFYTKQLIGISLFQQLKDIFAPLLYAVCMGAVVWSFKIFTTSLLIQIVGGIIIGIIAYFSIILILSRQSILEFRLLISKIFQK